MPVSGVVVDGFREPACRWCAGNRGLEFSTDVGSPVRAAVAGSVRARVELNAPVAALRAAGSAMVPIHSAAAAGDDEAHVRATDSTARLRRLLSGMAAAKRIESEIGIQ